MSGAADAPVVEKQVCILLAVIAGLKEFNRDDDDLGAVTIVFKISVCLDDFIFPGRGQHAGAVVDIEIIALLQKGGHRGAKERRRE